jgi:xyloglucan-specific exo-beta-1,4-glucanase
VGIFRSTDEGRNWLRIDDSMHHYGFVGVISGDPKVFGRVYLGTNGRGIPYGDPAGSP